MAHLSWEAADNIIKLVAPAGEALLWTVSTAWYRGLAPLELLQQLTDPELDLPYTSAWTPKDLTQLQHANFLKARSRNAPVHGYVKLFATVEARDGGLRRRVIAWPKATNSAEQQVLRCLRKIFHADVKFYSAASIRDLGLQYKFHASLDFKKFFQQFRLVAKSLWAVLIDLALFELDTIPTGAVFPPLFAQTLARALLAHAVRTTGTTEVVFYDCCIDNLRLVSDDMMALTRAWAALLSCAQEVNITVGEKNLPGVFPYTYLGMTFFVDDHDNVKVRIADKSRAKIEKAALSLADPLLGIDILAIFGLSIWAATVTDSALSPLYYIIKFVRRIQSRGNLEELANIWPSLILPWRTWLNTTASLSHSKHKAPTGIVTVYSDASDSGWGVVITDLPPHALTTIGGPWTEAEGALSVNVRELIAFKIALRILTSRTLGTPFSIIARIDNTSAIAWINKRRSPIFHANTITADIWQILENANLTLLSVDYVKSSQNLADAPSRWRATRQLPSGKPYP